MITETNRVTISTDGDFETLRVFARDDSGPEFFADVVLSEKLKTDPAAREMMISTMVAGAHRYLVKTQA